MCGYACEIANRNEIQLKRGKLEPKARKKPFMSFLLGRKLATTRRAGETRAASRDAFSWRRLM